MCTIVLLEKAIENKSCDCRSERVILEKEGLLGAFL